MSDEMLNKRFAKLLVVEQVDDYVAPSGGKHKKYKCLCDCGKYTEVLKEHLVSGRQKSCGCLKKEENEKITHGEINTRLYRIWGNMCNRCGNPNNPAWDNYGGRGIFVCEEWKKYEVFRDWARENGYSDFLTIDRIDNNQGYAPDNCRWTDITTQSNNKRNNHIIEYNGQSKTMSEWAAYLGISYKNLHNRIVSLNWEVERAFNQPLRKSPRHHNLPNKQDDQESDLR